jgi:hypothetical protein
LFRAKFELLKTILWPTSFASGPGYRINRADFFFFEAKRVASGPGYRINRADFFFLEAKRVASGPSYRINRADFFFLEAKRVASGLGYLINRADFSHSQSVSQVGQVIELIEPTFLTRKASRKWARLSN